MRLLDRIALQRLITLILNFILTLVKLFVPEPKEDGDEPQPKPPRKRWRPLRKK
jgi:hypothetical protein